MVNLVGFTQGMREQRGTLNRRRRELANAFNDFKAANPTATFDEYQSFIDQYTGDGLGSNYLRGGAPSEEVLKTLASENEKRRQAQEEQVLLESLQRRGKKDGLLQGFADDALLSTSGDDFDAAYQSFVDRLGGDQAVDQFGEDTLRSYIGPNRLNELISKQTQDALNNPALSNFLDRVNPNEIDAATVSDILGIQNKAVIDPIVSQAQTEARRRNNKRMQDRRDQIVDTMVNALNRGIDPEKTVRARYGDDVYFDSENMTVLMEEAQTSYEQERQRVEEEQKQEGIIFRADIEDRMKKDPGLLVRLRNATREEGLEIIRDKASGLMTPNRFETNYSGDNASRLIDLYEEVLSVQQAEASNRYNQYRRESEQMARERGDRAIEESVTLATTRNEARYDDEVTPSVARQLARKYRWNDAVQFEFAKLFDEGKIDTDATASEIAIQVENSPEFQAVAVPMNEYRNRLKDSARPFEFSTMDEALSQMSNEFEQTTRTELNELLDQAATVDNPSERAAELASLRRTIEAQERDFRNTMERFSRQRQIWLKPGGGGWDEEAVTNFVGDAGAAFDEMRRRLDNLEQQLQAERAQAEARSSGEAATSSPDTLAPRTQTTGPGGGNPGAGEPPIVEWWRRTVENMPANRGNPLGDR